MMKSIRFLLLLFISLPLIANAIGYKKRQSITTPLTNILRENLMKNAAKGCMFGHQDDPNYRTTWSYEENRSDVKEVCGDYPAVMGFDMGHLELGENKNLDGVPFDRIRQEAVKQFERGGLVTLSWHPNNPLTGKDAWDVSDSTVVKSILPNGKNHRKFQSWLKRVADFINSIKTSKGEKVPVVFRPWHENTGSWFWWGEKLCSTTEYKALWNMTVSTLKAYGVNNVLYAFSPGGGATEAQYMERYPGDQIIDILGTDIYQYSTNDNYIKDVKSTFDFIKKLGDKHHKIIAFTETGYQSIPEAEWWTKVLTPAIENYPISYVLVWRNAWDKKDHYFAPFKGEKSANDFVKFYESPKTLFARDTKLYTKK